MKNKLSLFVVLTITFFFFNNKFYSQNGSCASPSLVVQDDGNGTPGVTFNSCIANPNEIAGRIIIFTQVTSSADGTLGLIQSVGTSSAILCDLSDPLGILGTRVASLFPLGDCSGVPIAPYTTNAGNSMTFNPEWSGLTPNTDFVVRIEMDVPLECSGTIEEICLNQYSPAAPVPADACGTCLAPTCPIFNAPDFATSTASYPASNAYDPAADLVGPLTFTNCYEVTLTSAGTLGFKQGVVQSSACSSKTYSLKSNCNQADLAPDRLNANGSASGFNPEWDNLPAGTYVLCITTTLQDNNCSFDLSQTGFYVIPNVVPTCPTENTFITLDWNAFNSFIPFTNTNFDCSDPAQTIWKNLDENTWANTGDLQPIPGFIMDFQTNANSPNRTSILVNVNGVDFSYYGPTGTAPQGLWDWGPVTDDLSNLLVLEPYLPIGSLITLTVCDTRNNPQNFPYEIYDYANGSLLTSGTATPSNGNCTTITFNLSSPTLTWNIDGDQSLIVNNTDGSATFDPAQLSEGNHVINYTYDNGTCTLTASQNISISNTIIPTFDLINDLCLNSTPPLLPTTSNNGITGTWNDVISTAALGQITYTFTPGAGQCAIEGELTVDVVDQITPNFTQIDDLCQNSVAPTLPGTSTNGITGVWDAAISTVTVGNTTYNFTADANQCAADASMEIIVTQPITPTFTQIADLCQNSVAPILPGASTNGITGVWDAVISTSIVGNTNYDFTANSNECATGASMTITVTPQTIPTFTQILDLCQNSVAPALPSTSTNGINGTWNASISTITAGNTNYDFIANANECATDANMTITVIPQVTPTFTQISDLCQNSVAPALPTTSTNGIDGAWNASISTISAGNTTYNFTADANQCATGASMAITVIPLVTPTFTQISDLCQNSVAPALPTLSTNGIDGAWNASISTITAGNTTYNFTADVNQCASSTSMTVTILPLPEADATFTMNSAFAPSLVQFTNLSTNANSYSWDFGNNLNSIAENPSTEYLTEGTYKITLTATSALCGSSTWTSDITLLADLPLVYAVPNVFTPGGNDAINNSYFIPTENAKSFEAIIINRWGNVIYEMNQINQMWDGKTASGDEAEEGVYFIKFKIENLKGEFIEGQNFFHLVR